MATAQAQTTDISLSGSVEIVTEFFSYAVSSILFQRGIYSPEQFSRVSKYGLTMMMTTDHRHLHEYLWVEVGRLVVL